MCVLAAATSAPLGAACHRQCSSERSQGEDRTRDFTRKHMDVSKNREESPQNGW